MFEGVKAVLFDLDGTLVHSRIDFPAMRTAVMDLARAAGVDPTPYAPRDALALVEAVASQVRDASAFRSDVDQALVQIELAACEHAVEAPGAVETLQWLGAHDIRVGIVTRNSRQAVSIVLRKVPLPHEVLLTRADTPRVKPDPLHLHLALDRLRVPPDRAVMVGDHLMDVMGGRAAGMRTLGILDRDRPAGYFDPASPDGVIRHLDELRTWISPSS